MTTLSMNEPDETQIQNKAREESTFSCTANRAQENDVTDRRGQKERNFMKELRSAGMYPGIERAGGY